MNANPWNVPTLDKFLFYCCPECDNKYVTKSHFVEHALTSHQVSQEYIPSILQNMMSAVTKPTREIVTKPLVNHPLLQNVISGSDLNEEIEVNDPEKDVNFQEINENLDSSDEEETQPQPFEKRDRIHKEIRKANLNSQIKKRSQNPKVKNSKAVKSLLLYKCHQCGKNLKSKSNLENHVRNFHVSVRLNKRLKCDRCDKILGTNLAMQYHMENVHNKDYHLPGKSLREIENVHIGDQQVQNVQNREKRTENVHNEDYQTEQMYIEDHQNENVHNENYQTEQMYVHKEDNMGNVHNGNQYVENVHEEYHMKNVHKDGHDEQDECRKYFCDKCDKSFKQKGYLKTHMKNVHEGVTYKCELCDLEFSSSGALMGHKRQIHPNESTKKYKCTQCPYFTYTKALFQNHVQNKHY